MKFWWASSHRKQDKRALRGPFLLKIAMIDLCPRVVILKVLERVVEDPGGRPQSELDPKGCSRGKIGIRMMGSVKSNEDPL